MKLDHLPEWQRSSSSWTWRTLESTHVCHLEEELLATVHGSIHVKQEASDGAKDLSDVKGHQMDAGFDCGWDATDTGSNITRCKCPYIWNEINSEECIIIIETPSPLVHRSPRGGAQFARMFMSSTVGDSCRYGECDRHRCWR